MLSKLDAVAIGGLIVAGTIHTVFTPIFNPAWTLETVWFAGTGLALIFLGLLNIARRRSTDAMVRRLSGGANIVGLIYMGVVVGFIAAPHVLAIMVFLLVTSAASVAPMMTRQVQM